MSKLFTFYNTEIEDSHLITVWESPIEGEYIAGWDGFERSFLKSEIDDKVKSGAYQVVENFLKTYKFNPYKHAEELFKKFNKVEEYPNYIDIQFNKGSFSVDKSFESISEAIEYLQALEKVFGEH